MHPEEFQCLHSDAHPGQKQMMQRSRVWEKFSSGDVSLSCSSWIFWELVGEALLLTFLGVFLRIS